MSEAPWPTEIRRLQGGRALRVAFDDGQAFELSGEYLRVESPSAEVRGHRPSERRIESGKRNVTIGNVEPVGNYAVRLTFSDGHSTGIYTWTYLRELGVENERRWADYLRELAARGASR